MPPRRSQQTLSYPLRLPDTVQTGALRLLEGATRAINEALVALWPRLDEFAEHEEGPAWKQVEGMFPASLLPGSRLWRCACEQVGRILRTQAHRKALFLQVLPLLSEGLIRSKTEHRRAGKDRQAIRQALAGLKASSESDGGRLLELQSLIEQACNWYLTRGAFPVTYEQMQASPVLSAGILPYAGDDGPEQGQAYRMELDLPARQLRLALRTPEEDGGFRRTWRRNTVILALPELVTRHLESGEALAPTLRAVEQAGGSRYAVLDLTLEVPVAPAPAWEKVENVLGFDWGVRKLVTVCAVDRQGEQVGQPFFLNTGCFDGRQARTRRQIDLLKAKVASLETRRSPLPPGAEDSPSRKEQQAWYQREIGRCWRKYHARNRDLAHLAANILLLMATVQGCALIAGESLKTLKSTGRGRDTQGRWRNWRNNSQIRGELWRVLAYKCHLAGIRLEWQRPRGTSHTCPRCGLPAATYRSPAHRERPQDWGAWLCCTSCGWNGSRDYAAALNIARLGAAFVTHYLRTGHFYHASISEQTGNPVSYRGAGARLRLPSPVPRSRPPQAGTGYVNGWQHSVTLRPSYVSATMLRPSG